MHKPVKNQPLTECPTGTRLIITDLQAGAKSRSRLCALGLIPGTIIVVDSGGPGPCRVKVRESDVCLGQGLAEKIIAAPAD